MWKRTERKTRKDKIQAIVDECSRQINKELKDNEYPQEMRKKGLRETFERWKKVKIFLMSSFLMPDLYFREITSILRSL